MESRSAIRRRTVGVAVFALLGGAVVPRVTAQAPSGTPAAAALFALLDANKDGTITRDELKTGLDAWYTQWDAARTDAVTFEQVFRALNAAIPAPAPGAARPQNQVPRPEDVAATMAALPEKAPARPRRPRKVLVLGKAAGFVHTSIPIAARAVQEMGLKTGAWATTITYDPADVNDENLAHYDAIFLASTTGAFLDDPNDAAATAARRKALLDFVRGGKGVAGVHAACDSYHRNAAPAAEGPINWDLVAVVSRVMTGDTNGDGKLSRQEVGALAEVWYQKLDPEAAGRVARADMVQRFAALPVSQPPARSTRGNGQGPATDVSPDQQVGTWPDFNRIMGAFFKWHWNDGQPITVKLDDPEHPLNAPFGGRSWDVVDEIYTFSRDTYSRGNLRVLTSVDYTKMSA
ncbi:MAG TPA: ThuA domain-containing protein, partial [Coriobacteriia bacterium]